MKTIRFYSLLYILFALVLGSQSTVYAQTPGLIYKPATNGGDKILDPNRDGYVSKTKSGFPGLNLDTGTNSEIAYIPFPVLESEPVGDLATGPTNGHTDFAEPEPLAYFFDGTNFLFRVRLGGQSSASKGYSILIDSDLDVNQPGYNPGFEYEVVLATNFDVRIYNHTGSYNSPGPQIFNGSVDQFSQKSFAASQEGGDDDYFYDFYVPISAFQGGITSSTFLRMTATTITSGGKGFYGTLSDKGAIDDHDYKSKSPQPFKDVIGAYPPTAPDGTQPSTPPPTSAAAAPQIDKPIYTTPTQTVITGSSIEVRGSTISVYRNGTLIGTTTVDANGRWSLPLGAQVLNAGDVITATASVTNKTTSPASNPETVQAVPPTFESCKTTLRAPYIEYVDSKGWGFVITTYAEGTLKRYKYNSALGRFVDEGYIWLTDPGTTEYLYYEQGGSGQVESGLYAFTFTPKNSTCESELSNEICVEKTGGSVKAVGEMTAPPTISPATDLVYTSTQIRGTTDPGTTVILYKNTKQVTRITPTPPVSPSTKATWTYNIPTGSLLNGDIFWARAEKTTSFCTTTPVKSEQSNSIRVVYPVTTAPVITGSYCGPTTVITGTSNEAAGTQIRLYSGGALITSPAGPHAVVDQYGYWQANGLNLNAGNTITATATNTVEYKSASPVSNAVTIKTPYNIAASDLSINGPVTEGSTSLSGKAPTGSYVILYINGEPYANADGIPYNTQAQAGNTWTLTNISPFELFAGASLTIKASMGSTCSSTASSAPVIVECRTPNQAIGATFDKTGYCPASYVSVNLDSSEPGIIYNLYIRTASQTDANAVVFGNSVLGTGKAIKLTSQNTVSTADNGKVIIIKTEKEGSSCSFKIGSDMPLVVYADTPKDLSATNADRTCPGDASTISVANVDQNYTYQLYNVATGANIGSPITPTSSGGNITFPAFPVYETTDYNIKMTRVGGDCVQYNDDNKKITITRTTTTVNQTVTPTSRTICSGTTASFSFDSQTNHTYRLINKVTGNQEGPSVEGTGNQITLTTGNLTNAGTHNYRIEVERWFYFIVRIVSCRSYLITEPSVTVISNSGMAASAGPNQKICGSPTGGVSATLNGSNPAPGTGTWSKKSGNGGSITNVNDPNTTVTGLTSGTYVFTWTVTTTCGSGTNNSSDVTITVNCEPQLTTSTNRFYGDYVNNDLLATISDDVDGGIVALPTIISGTLPPSTKFELDPDNKLRMRVVNTASLVPGSYTLSVRTTDARGVTSDVPMLIRIYSRTEPPTPPTPLPVQLAYFTALKDTYSVTLKWVTLSEIDNDHFEIERSADKQSFEKIGIVAGAGNSAQVLNYTFTDSRPNVGTNYYRLKMVDYSGRHTYSNIIAVNMGSSINTANMEAYPNPFRKEINISISLPDASKLKFELLNINGTRVHEETHTLESGLNTIQLQNNNLSEGMYILKVTGSEINFTSKLLKTR